MQRYEKNHLYHHYMKINVYFCIFETNSLIMKKNYTIKSLCIAVAMIFAGFGASAQLENSLFLNVGFPTGQFNDKAEMVLGQTLLGKANIGKEASMGFGLGYRCSYHFDIGFGEVAPFVNADLLWNQIKSDYRDSYTRAKADIPSYFNIPVMLGVNYRYALTDIIKVFGEFGLGSDFFIITAEGWNSNNTQEYHRYKVKNALTWELGAGAYFGSHVSAGLYYYGLGKHAITYNTDKSHGPVYALDVDNSVELRKLGTLALRIGFHF